MLLHSISVTKLHKILCIHFPRVLRTFFTAMVCLNYLVTLGFLVAGCIGYLVDPPTTAPSNTISDCSNWVVVATGDKCADLASSNSITLAQFDTYVSYICHDKTKYILTKIQNPSVGTKCVLIIGDSYCVEENFGIPPATITSTSTSKVSTKSGITTPAPIQTGMIGTCNAFYLVASGDQ